MKRLYESTLPGEGAVYRNLSCTTADPLGSSSSGGEELGCLECLGHPVVDVITGPGCASFPVQDNNIGALPTTFAADVEIDTYGFDPDFSSLSSETPDPVFTDMWDMLSDSHKLTVMITDCYCPGDGVTRPGLTFGRPRFPTIPTLPFFWIPIPGTGAGGGGEPGEDLTIREDNPVQSLSPDCCESESEYIKAEIVNGEIQLTPFLRPDFEEKYRAKDTHTTFQLRAGYPRWCCIQDDCGESNPGPDDPEHVLRWLHFHRWPGPETHDPYASSDAKEPLGVYPRVVDIQCDYNTGLLHVYYANDIVHDGHLADIQWDVFPPRPQSSDGPVDFDPRLPPTHPEQLPVNEDYQENHVYDPGAFNHPIGELCDENCDIAAANLGRPDDACELTCMSDGVLCPDESYSIESTGVALTEAVAIVNAYAASVADTATNGCVPSVTALCYTQQIGAQWEAVVKACCPAGQSLSSL